jgi:hypothetical protein
VLIEIEVEAQPNRNLLVETKRFPSPEHADAALIPDRSLLSACLAAMVKCCCGQGKDDGTLFDYELWNSAPYKMLFIHDNSLLTKIGTFTDDPVEAQVVCPSITTL